LLTESLHRRELAVCAINGLEHLRKLRLFAFRSLVGCCAS
jgi:hypothetical protein